MSSAAPATACGGCNLELSTTIVTTRQTVFLAGTTSPVVLTDSSIALSAYRVESTVLGPDKKCSVSAGGKVPVSPPRTYPVPTSISAGYIDQFVSSVIGDIGFPNCVAGGANVLSTFHAPAPSSSTAVENGGINTTTLHLSPNNTSKATSSSSTMNSSPSASTSFSTPTGLDTGARIGIGVGITIGALLVLAAAALIIFLRRKRRAAREETYGKQELSAEQRAELERTEARRELGEGLRHELDGGIASRELS